MNPIRSILAFVFVLSIGGSGWRSRRSKTAQRDRRAERRPGLRRFFLPRQSGAQNAQPRRLHDQSVRLTDFHVAPMCTPTRGQLMTGLDALHNGASSVCCRPLVRPPRHSDDGRDLRRRRLSHRPFRQVASRRQLSEPAASARLSGDGLSHGLGHHLDGRLLAERLLRRPLSPQRRAAAIPGLLHRRLVQPGDGLDASSSRRPASRSFCICRPTRRTARIGSPRNTRSPTKAKGPAAFLRHDRQPRREHGPAAGHARRNRTGATTRSSSISTTTAAPAGVQRLQRRHARQEDDLLRRRASRRLLHPLAGRRLARAAATSTR